MLYGLDSGKKRISATILNVDKEIIKDYMQGSVYSFCKNNPGEVFSVRILFGGMNNDWNGTPLQRLYDNHAYVRKSKNPKHQTAIDAGRLLREVLENDSRKFEYAGNKRGHRYRMK